MNIKRQNPDAFLDLGYLEGYPFRQKFLSSPEFTIEFLKGFKVFKRSELTSKEGHAFNLAEALEKDEISSSEVLLKYVQKPRTWLSLKKGTCSRFPQLQPVENLLKSFGTPGWYGPIREILGSRIWYVRIYEIPHYITTDVYTDSEGNQKRYGN